MKEYANNASATAVRMASAMVEKTANDYEGATDSDVIEQAIASRAGRPVVLPKRVAKTDPQRDWWLIDRAILLPSDTTLVLRDCKVKLSDTCRDNFIRSANCGLGVANIPTLSNIRIIGEGKAVLEGADHPRATGDGGKTIRHTSPHENADWLRHAYWVDEAKRADMKKPDFWDIHNNTYGTDSGKEGESQFGDWRNNGIQLANVSGFLIDNITMKDTHGWAMCLESCSTGEITRIHFDMIMSMLIDGMKENIENQDGIDLRAGCHDILIDGVTGRTGDDVVALTAFGRDPDPAKIRKAGSLRTTEVMDGDFKDRPSAIHNVTVRNIVAQSFGGCCVIRLLPVHTCIHDVVISNVVDTLDKAMAAGHWGATILLGEGDGGYGRNLPDSMRNITVTDVASGYAPCPVVVAGFLADSSISNVTSRCSGQAVRVLRPDGLKNVKVDRFEKIVE